MTVVALLVDPPREGLVGRRLPDETPLSPEEAADAYAAGVKDTARAVVASGGDLLVNYRTEESLPEEHRAAEGTAEETTRELIAAALEDLDADDPRVEPQVGSTVSARAGNTVTHLLEEEDATSAAVLRGTAPLLERTHVDSAAMKLRRSATVLGPTPGGRVHYAGFAEPLDFEDAYAEPAVETLTDRAVAADHGVDFVPMLPRADTPAGLATTVSTVRARAAAERPVPYFTATLIDDLGLRVEHDDGASTLVVE
jgi:hypothetical protein